MRFISKFLLTIISIAILTGLHFYNGEFCEVILKLKEFEITAGVYLIIASFVCIVFVVSFITSIIKRFFKIFVKNQNAKNIDMINDIAELIQLNGTDFFNRISRTKFTKEFDRIKTSLLVAKKFEKISDLSLTGLKLIDIEILKDKLQKQIKNKSVADAIDTAKEIIKNYSPFVYKIENELLEIATSNSRNLQNISFDPRKFKFNLSDSFIKKYFFYLDCSELEKEILSENKIKILNKLIKKHSEICESYDLFLNFIAENNIKTLDDKKNIELIKSSFKLNPRRSLAFDLIRLNKQNQFEIAQDITNLKSSDESEKLWFLLIIAINSKFNSKTIEIISRFKNEDDKSKATLMLIKANQNAISNLQLEKII